MHRRLPRRAAPVAAFLAFAAVLSATLPARSRSAAAEEPAPSVPVPAPTRERPQSIADEAARKAILDVIDELRPLAAEIRGLPWKYEVPADVISRTEMRKDFERSVKEELKPHLYERDLKVARRLGLLGDDEDPIAMTLQFMERGVAGYYDPKRRHFYVIEGLSADAQRPTILHELVHALEDQHHDLRAQVDRYEENGDALFAMKCVQEGSAEVARRIYESRFPEAARASQAEQAKSPDREATLKAVLSVPAVLVVGTMLHYQTGPAFVGRFVRDGDYPSRMEALYKEGPTTQEQVLRPSRWVGEHKDLPRRIELPGLEPALGEGWKGLKATPVGELDLALWLDRWLGGTKGRLTVELLSQGRYWSKAAGVAAEGWDGGWLQVVEHEGAPKAVSAVFAFDTAKDAQEAAKALHLAIEQQHAATVTKGAFGPVADGAGARASWTSSYGAGRVEVAGDVVWLLDGVPADRLEAAFEVLKTAPVERDPADTWAPENEEDALAGVTWRAKDNTVGWRLPKDGWAATGTPADGAVKGGLSLRLETVKGRGPAGFNAAVTTLVKRHPGAAPDVSTIEELAVGGKGGARLRMDDGGGAPEQRRERFVYFVPLGDTSLVLTFEAQKGGLAAAQGDIDAALAGLVFAD